MLGYYLDLAWRRCRKGPAMVALLVLTVAIGIAATMTAMTIFSAFAGAPIPGVSDHLYVVTMDAREQTDSDNNTPYATPDSLLNLRDAKALIDAHRASPQAALALGLTTLATPDHKQSTQAFGLIAYGRPLATLGVPIRFGRPWTQAEQDADKPVILIDANAAETLFGTVDAVGRSVALGSREFRVVGVTAPWQPRLRIIDIAENTNGNGVLGQNLQFFVPVQAALDAGVGPFIGGECPKGSPLVVIQSAAVGACRWLETWVTLPTMASVSTYSRFAAGYADVQHQSGRFVHAPQARLYGARAWLDVNQVVPDDISLNVMLAGAFLLLCMVNVAGLLAARFLRRQVDVAIRRALGASRRHVFAQHLVEAGMLGLAGGILALPLTLLGLWIVRMQPVGYAAAAQFSVGVFVMLVVLSLIVGLLVGILPAWRVCRQPPALQIKVA